MTTEANGNPDNAVAIRYAREHVTTDHSAPPIADHPRKRW